MRPAAAASRRLFMVGGESTLQRLEVGAGNSGNRKRFNAPPPRPRMIPPNLPPPLRGDPQIALGEVSWGNITCRRVRRLSNVANTLHAPRVK